MTRAMDVLSYVRSQTDLYGEVQAHKLLYLAQGWTLAWEGRPLFADPIEAWQMGPVVKCVRRSVDKTAKDPNAIDDRDKPIVDAALAKYGEFTGQALMHFSHEQAPWVDAWGDRGPTESGDNEITFESMRRFFTREAILGRGPARPRSSVRDAATTVVCQTAHDNAQRWRRTLARLAE